MIHQLGEGETFMLRLPSFRAFSITMFDNAHAQHTFRCIQLRPIRLGFTTIPKIQARCKCCKKNSAKFILSLSKEYQDNVNHFLTTLSFERVCVPAQPCITSLSITSILLVFAECFQISS